MSADCVGRCWGCPATGNSANFVGRPLSPKLFEPGGVGGGVLDGVFDVPVAKVILNEPGIGALVGKGEAAGMAEHVGMGAEGQGSGGAVSGEAQLTVERCSGFRCSLTKKVLPAGCIRARS